jgi:hypothetical protein
MASQLRKYTNPDRLADVLALLQMLALAKDDRSSELEIKNEVGPPRSSARWTSVAEEHPEFFRVRPARANDPDSTADNKTRLSLLARHAMPLELRVQFPIDFVQALITTAINLHDREVARRDKRWLYVALVGSAATIAAAVIGAAVKIIFHSS